MAMRRIERWYARRAGCVEGRGGSVTVLQRFGSSLALNLHYHSIMLDGVFTRGAGNRLSFRRVVPHTPDIEALVVEIADACEAYLVKRGFGPDDAVVPDEDDGQSLCQAASVGGYTAVGERSGQQARRVQRLGGREYALPPRCAGYEGYNLHAGVAMAARNRSGLERLCRYVQRPPLAQERLSRKPDGTIVVGMKRVWSDGTAAVEFSPMELTERLCALVPPPYSNQVIYRGVLAGNAAWRSEVVPKPPKYKPRERLTRRLPKGLPSERPGWADLLWRVFEKDGFECPRCGGRLVLRAVVPAPAAAGLLETLERAVGPPSTRSADEDRVAH